MDFDQLKERATTIGARLEAALGQTIYLREYPALDPLQDGRITIGLVHESIYRTVAMLSTNGGAEALTLVGADLALGHVRTADPETVVARVLGPTQQWLQRGAPINALDAGFTLYDAVIRNIGVPNSTFTLEPINTFDPKPSETGMRLELRGQYAWDELVRFQHRDRLFYLVSAHAADATGFLTGYIITPDELQHLLGHLLHHIRTGIDGRESFRLRPLKFEFVVSRIIDELRKLDSTANWTAAPPSRGYPEWPHTVIVHDLQPPQRYVTVNESAAGFDLRAYRFRTQVKSPADFERELPQLLAACAEQLRRLTADKLVAGRVYVAKAAFLDLTPGDELRFEGQGWDPRMDFERYAFRRLNGPELVLDMSRDEHAAIVDDLDRFLRKG